MQSPEADKLLDTMRTEIERYGQSIVGCDKLLILVSPNDPIGAQYGHIFLTAVRERWTFEFRNDGTVRFTRFERDQLRTTEPVDPKPENSQSAEGVG